MMFSLYNSEGCRYEHDLTGATTSVVETRYENKSHTYGSASIVLHSTPIQI